MQKLIVCHHARVVLATVWRVNPDTNYEKLELNTWKSSPKDLQPSKFQKTNFCAALNEQKNFIFRHEWKRGTLFFGKVLPSFECEWYWDSIPDLMHGNFIFFPSHIFFSSLKVFGHSPCEMVEREGKKKVFKDHESIFLE